MYLFTMNMSNIVFFLEASFESFTDMFHITYNVKRLSYIWQIDGVGIKKKKIYKNKNSEDSIEKLHLSVRKCPPTNVKLVIFVT